MGSTNQNEDLLRPGCAGRAESLLPSLCSRSCSPTPCPSQETAAEDCYVHLSKGTRRENSDQIRKGKRRGLREGLSMESKMKAILLRKDSEEQFGVEEERGCSR
ncbi:hypothetical protein Y1Q_0015154 [Alligator mississippiensis]|uniref:Uncharacterized protein n=1 Tax=Alligator mississippiensis TaxID=8496 RepID=A0A151P8S5_ALLMI|nr:hypothetical protein Y1Q_0015154 [Alligator mississippiensis]